MITIQIKNMPLERVTEEIFPWLLERDIHYSTVWPYGAFAFVHECDASAFLLRYGGERVITTLERMINDENSIN